MILTVLRTGGLYRQAHVEALRAQCAIWAPGEPFGCLTDAGPITGVRTARLSHGWPSWWAKLELFRPDVLLAGTRILYLDLDTVVIGPLFDLLARPEAFLALADFYRRPPLTSERGLGSGLMAWTAGDPHVTAWYRDFAAAPEAHMRACGFGGDQRFLERAGALDAVTFWEDVCPGQVASYKVHCRAGAVPPGVRVVCFHGRPKPWQVAPLATGGTICHT